MLYENITNVGSLVGWAIGWTGNGTAPPKPEPAPAVGTWAKHLETTCENSSMLVDKGTRVDLNDCQAACVALPACHFIAHTDQSDNHCVLYR
jgi:hypothetical protein